jgi:enoyl-CoA hydratase
MNFPDYQTLQFTRNGRVLTIAINRPEQRNAVNGQLHTELARVFVDAQRDEDSDVVVLTGNGAAFSAGGDLPGLLKRMEGGTPASHYERSAREAKDIAYTMLDLEKPLICKLNGHATGLGASMALLCDIVVASEDAKIGDPHVAVGLVAADGGALLWPQLIGYAKARKYLFTGDLMTAPEAERLGLISDVVPRAELDATVDALAQRIANGATKAIRYTKIVANLPLRALFHSHFDAGLAYERLTLLSHDHKEAVKAFVEKRKPQFKGE